MRPLIPRDQHLDWPVEQALSGPGYRGPRAACAVRAKAGPGAALSSHRPYHEEPPEDLEDLDAGAVVLFLAVVLAAVVLAAVALGAAS